VEVVEAEAGQQMEEEEEEEEEEEGAGFRTRGFFMGSVCAARVRFIHLLQHWPYKVRRPLALVQRGSGLGGKVLLVV
jgi:hypothetical protein